MSKLPDKHVKRLNKRSEHPQIYISNKTLEILNRKIRKLEMTTTNSTTVNSLSRNPKKSNLLDHHSIKHLLDETVSEVYNAIIHNSMRYCYN